MSINFDDEKYLDLIFRGMKEASDLEIQRLREEGYPVLVWRDGKVVDISRELQLPPAQSLSQKVIAPG